MSVLEALKYLLLGLVQGVTEVLPISSSGHVEFVKALVNLDSRIKTPRINNIIIPDP